MKSKNIWYFTSLMLFLLLSVSADISGQSDDISIYGVVRDHMDNKKIPNVDIIVYENGKKIFERKTNLNGKYDFVLDFNKYYKILYQYPNYVSKYLTIDVRDVPEKDRIGGFEMNIDMTLFKEVEGLDVSILDDPIGKAEFDPKRGEMTWDMAYTNMMQKKIRDLMRRHDAKIEEEVVKQDKMEDDFKNLVRLGDAGMKNKNYDSAVGYYTEALALIPDDESVKNKLKEAQSAAAKLAAERDKKDKYDGLIKKADSFFNKSDWDNALASYQAAGEIFPKEQYPKIRIQTIHEKLDAERNKAKVAAQVMALLKEGDRLIAMEEYDDGIAKFEEVLSLESNNSEAKRKLIDARKKRDAWLKNQELEGKYKESITLADKLFLEKNYPDAIREYRKALLLKQGESYPEQQIKKAEEYLSLAKAAEEMKKSFDDLVRKGDTQISYKEYQKGIDFYNQALGIYADNQEVKEKIKSAEQKIADLLAAEEAARKQKERDEQFANLVDQGDNAFGMTNYDDAIGFYQQALKIKSDVEVEGKIDDARKKINSMLADKQRDEQYAEVIRKADKALADEKYDEAINNYKQALTIKEKEDYPKNQLVQIDAILSKMAADEKAKRQKELDDRFNAFVNEGDELVRREDYNMGISSYEKALELKPGSEEVIAKIEDARSKQNDKMALLAVDEQYASLIKDADKLFRAQDWENAKNKYNEAYGVKNEQYPLDKIDEIDLKLAQLAEAEKNKAEAEKQEMFGKLEREGDNAVDLTDYTEGISKYNQALQIYPDNQRVMDKIANAQNLMAESNAVNELNDQYNSLIAAADDAFNNEAYTTARDVYQNAINLKPNESYPKNKIDEIDLILLEMEKKKAEEEKDALFAQLEEEGDKNVDRASYDQAIEKYDQALEIYPEDARVQQKAGKARQLLKTAKSAQELEQMYNDFITKADGEFNAEDYHNARMDYQQAFALLPQDYPKDQIEKIDRILLDIEKRKVQEEAARLAQMNVKEDDTSWEENISDEQKYILDAKKRKDEAERSKYDEFLAYKKSLEDTHEDYVETGDSNRSGNASVIEEEKNVKGQLYDKTKREDDQRQVAEVFMVKEMDQKWVNEKNQEQLNKIRMSRQAEEYEAYHRELQKKHNELIVNNYNNSKKAAQVRYKKYGEKESLRQRNIDEINRQKSGLKNFKEVNSAKQKKHISEELEYSEAVKSTQSKGLAVGDNLAAKNYNNLKSEEELRKIEKNAWQQKSDLKRSVEFEEVKRSKWPAEKKPYQYYPKEETKSYQQGVTEETLTEGNNQVVRRTVVVGNKIDQYKMVITNHGTYYFKNGDSISKTIWKLDTEKGDGSD